MPRYTLAESANRDIDGILAVIHAQNETAAWDWYLALHKKFDTLARAPGIGRVRQDLLPGLSMFPFGNYLIFYDAVPDGIQIVHVVHGARDVRHVFSQEAKD
jgi:toxin ParE1/3/4